MTDDEQRLADCWTRRFGEPPTLVDAELMRAVMADLDDEEAAT